MTRVIAIGECMVELRAREDGAYARAFAGDAFNLAAYLKRSAPNARVCFLTVTGNDPISAAMRAAWAKEGVDDALAFQVADAIPGLYMINVDAAGERSFTYWRSASAARRWFNTLNEYGGSAHLRDADLVYFSGISLAILPDEQRSRAIALIASAKAGGAKIAFDPNYRPSLWENRETAQLRLREAMAIADIVLPSREDLDALDLAPPASAESVITNGAAGCVIAAPGLHIEMPAPRVDAAAVKDTSGAGDSFTGAYLAARLQGAAPQQAAEAALAVAARVVTAPGALVPKHISHPQG